VIARLLDERPAGWLPPGSADWRAEADRILLTRIKTGAPS